VWRRRYRRRRLGPWHRRGRDRRDGRRGSICSESAAGRGSWRGNICSEAWAGWGGRGRGQRGQHVAQHVAQHLAHYLTQYVGGVWGGCPPEANTA